MITLDGLCTKSYPRRAKQEQHEIILDIQQLFRHQTSNSVVGENTPPPPPSHYTDGSHSSSPETRDSHLYSNFYAPRLVTLKYVNSWCLAQGIFQRLAVGVPACYRAKPEALVEVLRQAIKSTQESNLMPLVIFLIAHYLYYPSQSSPYSAFPNTDTRSE